MTAEYFREGLFALLGRLRILLGLRQAPKAEGMIKAGCHGQFSVGRDGDIVKLILVDRMAQFFSRRDVPDTQGFVGAARGEDAAAVRREGHALNIVRVSFAA